MGNSGYPSLDVCALRLGAQWIMGKNLLRGSARRLASVLPLGSHILRVLAS